MAKEIEYKECWKCIEHGKVKELGKCTHSVCKKGHALWFPDQCPAYTESQATTVTLCEENIHNLKSIRDILSSLDDAAKDVDRDISPEMLTLNSLINNR